MPKVDPHKNNCKFSIASEIYNAKWKGQPQKTFSKCKTHNKMLYFLNNQNISQEKQWSGTSAMFPKS